MRTLIAALGSLAIGLAPLLCVHLADLPQVPKWRRPFYVAFVVGLAVATAALGVVWVLGWLGTEHPELLTLAAFALFVLVSAIPLGVFEFFMRRRRVRRELWREAHPNEDVLPQSRLERHMRRDLDRIAAWHAEAEIAMLADLAERGWVTTSRIEATDARRPSSDVLPASRARAVKYVSQQSVATRTALEAWTVGARTLAGAVNAQHLQAVKSRRKGFFDTVERSPLTEEQVEAVVCMDDRVRLIAAAGSGKTSTLVAKAAYAVAEGIVQADRILVLAFNDAAAREARDRLRTRLSSLGLPDAVEVRTFHSLGSALVGRARGRKPAVASYIAQRRETEVVAEIVALLSRRDPHFAGEWALFRAVYADAAPEEGPQDVPTLGNTLLTRSGDLVRSRGEQLIADWLWFQGVEFEYERPYPVDLADAEHRQYTPDFHYPAVDLWHEHFALDAAGAAPAHFDGYQQSIDWKRRVHRQHGSRYFETTTAQIDDGSLISRLTRELQSAGIVLQPDANRPVRGRPLLQEERLLDLFLKALRATKRDGISSAEYDRRAATLTRGGARNRALVFGRLLAQIRTEWDARLAADGTIDFEGMVAEAADALDNGRVAPEFDLVLVDEFQDMSAGFTRLLQALLMRPGSRLFAVGDDWQAINGFAGADVTALLDFETRFGAASTRRLERTFRSSQPICDVAGAFVMQNPAQLTKDVVSGEEAVPASVRIRVVDAEARQPAAVEEFLRGLQRRIDSARATGRAERDRSVLLLGRYNRTERLVPDLDAYPALRCSFSTIHQAKGREADYVVLLDAVGGSDGFPSMKRDDPVLDLLRASREGFPCAEERRLLYVALTRARRAVLVVTTRRSMSSFAGELAVLPGVRLEDDHREELTLCPSCSSGVLQLRTSAHGPFSVCSRSACGFKQDGRSKASARRVAAPRLLRTP